MGDRVIMYGTGSVAEAYLERHGAMFGNLRFASTEGGGMFRGHPVLSAEAASLDPAAEFVIASSFVGPIIETLRRLGVEAQRITWYDAKQDRLISACGLAATVLPEECLYAVYDLDANVPNYDALIFAVRADMERQRRGLKFLHFLVMPARLEGPHGRQILYGTGGPIEAGDDAAMIAAAFALVETKRGVSFLASRDEISPFLVPGAAVFPADYQPSAPRDEQALSLCYPAFEDGSDPRRLVAGVACYTRVDQLLVGRQRGRKLVTLTLREVPGEPDRTQCLEAWHAFLASLPTELMVVLVRDKYCVDQIVLTELPNLMVLPCMDFDLGMRLALYEKAHLNLIVHSGAANLLYLSERARYVSFNAQMPAYFDRCRDALDTRWHLKIDQAFPLAGRFQKLVWCRETAACMEHEFREMVRAIETDVGDRPEPAIAPAPSGAPSRQILDTELLDRFPEDDGTAAFAIQQGIFDKDQDHVAPHDAASHPWRKLFQDDRCGIFLTFGQSNAANAGETPYRSKHAVFSLNFLDKRCHPASDPLPGCGGRGGSVWSRLGDRLIEKGLFDRVLFVPVALGGTYISEWLPGGPSHRRIALALSRLRKALGVSDLTFSAALWAQGESDANDGNMSIQTYQAYLQDIAADLRRQGVAAPLFVAKSTRGPHARNQAAIGMAQDLVVDRGAGIFAGPDTDVLIGDDRFEGYHFSQAGLEKAADLWLRCLLDAAWALGKVRVHCC